ncbi:MAG: Jag N-terminal domain-containing protein [Candidatus Omnitrophota bacterium]|jgi:spoIIIJ-associated protein|nr:Jag N-terminal domain-containing protein [Candidatus Omnitrophota bacterium]MDD3982591.1 Jag N-terminal domain-containing protein [Candidatus Omnitrophota bacterium]MDD5525832.1 Jag N-terminal domain-containing protein [Candidatus Omnitrophota bacterium]
MKDPKDIESYEFEGNSFEDAIQQALTKLKIPKEKLSVEILTEGAKGLFGMPGVKPARIRVSIKTN